MHHTDFPMEIWRCWPKLFSTDLQINSNTRCRVSSRIYELNDKREYGKALIARADSLTDLRLYNLELYCIVCG